MLRFLLEGERLNFKGRRCTESIRKGFLEKAEES
jgi:hypothetical protein